MTTTIHRFDEGRTYRARSIANPQWSQRWTVVHRTERYVWLDSPDTGEAVRRLVKVGGTGSATPDVKTEWVTLESAAYSTAPFLVADRSDGTP